MGAPDQPRDYHGRFGNGPEASTEAKAAHVHITGAKRASAKAERITAEAKRDVGEHGENLHKAAEYHGGASQRWDAVKRAGVAGAAEKAAYHWEQHNILHRAGNAESSAQGEQHRQWAVERLSQGKDPWDETPEGRAFKAANAAEVVAARKAAGYSPGRDY